MNIVVNADKVRSELQTARTHRDGPKRLTACEVDVLLAALRGERFREFGQKTGRASDTISATLARVRERLNVRNNTELAYLAYERGYVTIEEGA